MIRLLLTLSLALDCGSGSVSTPLFDAFYSAQSRTASAGDPHFKEEALTGALVWMQHVLKPSGYAVRRLVVGHPWAWAGNGFVRTRVWVFEQPDPDNVQAPLRMHNAKQGSTGEDRPEPESPVMAKARTVLENLRRTPMVVGGRFHHEFRRILQGKIQVALEQQRVPRRLAARIALQLLRKFQSKDLGDERVWLAMGQLLNGEIAQLRQRLRLTDRQIIVALPKLSADHVEQLFQELREIDRKFGRTLAQAALNGADPITTGQRYARAFKASLEHVHQADPKIARTLAAAAFKTRYPLAKALRYLGRFQRLVQDFRGDYSFVRTIAKAAFAAPNPLRTARQFIQDYQAIVADLTAKGLEPGVAHTFAGIAATAADPFPTAYRLAANFETVVGFAKQTHPSVARSVALAACRATDPLAAATTYLENYDRIAQIISQTDPRLAHQVAVQAFRSHDPLTWAQRFLKQLKAKRRNPSARSFLIALLIATLLSTIPSRHPPPTLATAA